MFKLFKRIFYLPLTRTKNLVLIFLLIFGIFLFSYNFFTINFIKAQQTSSDAIAIRVIPNSAHYSAAKWYQKQGFSGSPQSLMVDGYEAVRDGRTVYVNVANVIGDNLFTNIYLISYNQEAERATHDIFSQILLHWKFNANLSSLGHCRTENTIVCLKDSECPIHDFCDSLKARVVRDTRRLSDLTEIIIILDDYYDSVNHYPKLGAGTYLSNRTISVWPSWKDALSQELSADLPIDPINKLDPRECLGYNEITCWDEDTKEFAAINFPNEMLDNSLTYIYYTDSNGASRHICSYFESGLAIAGADIVSADCPQICLDFDKDGYGLFASNFCAHPEVDCDDTNPDVHSSSGPEICTNGEDDDCDGLTDCYDSDCFGHSGCSAPTVCNMDGVCDPGETCENCPADNCCVGSPTCGDGICDTNCNECNTCYGPGLDCRCGDEIICASAGEECDGESNCDSNCVWSTATCTDNDGDHYYIEASGCDSQSGFLGHNDCVDSGAGASNIFPGMAEICDSIDHNCDGNPVDGFSEENCDWLCGFNGYNWTGGGLPSSNCCGNDASEQPYQNHENSPNDYCHDNIDNDCDGHCDTLPNECYSGSVPDSDCTGICGNLIESDHIGPTAGCDQCGNVTDDDGNQTAPVFPTTEADWGTYVNMIDACDSACGPGLSTIDWDRFEPVNETSCDGLDNDCDGSIDEAITRSCYTGPGGTEGVGICSAGTEICSAGIWGACVGEVTPQAEICGNGIDENCDGADEACPPVCTDNDGDGFSLEGGVCGAVDCNDDPLNGGAFCFPGNPAGETCDGHDNDCVGGIDEGCDDDNDDYCDMSMLWFSTTSECPNTIAGPNGDDCNDTLASGAGIHPNAAEICDGIDNNCVNGIDEGFNNENCQNVCFNNGFNWAGNGGLLNCCGNDANEAGPYQIVESACDDNNDNDCDGDIDCDDSDCDGTPACPVICTFPFTFPCVFP